MKDSCCWVAVDKDGTEKISNLRLMRRRYVKWISGGCFLSKLPVFYSKNNSCKWANGVAWTADESDNMPFVGVTLPKGTIEKLIGKKITWKDEPVEILINK